MSTKTLTVDLSQTAPAPSYDIVIGEGVLTKIGSLIEARLGKCQCVIISDSNVAPLYGKKVETSLSASGLNVLKTVVFPAGESSKNFTQFGSILGEILTLGLDRKTTIVALGGGVVGDMAGFAASVALRGINFVQVPTSLLAQVDSSVGGKTGIDMANIKNSVGAFYQPRLVVADVSTLSTLPKRELLAGYAEVVKNGLIDDRIFFDWCVANGKKVVNGDREAQSQAIEKSCAAKARVVAEDAHEKKDKRACLNLGHTFGHALETATGFGDALVHGEAVAIGTVMAFMYAVQNELCPQKDLDDVLAHFKAVGLPIAPPAFHYDVNQLVGLMASDKKAEQGKITLIVPHGIGKAKVLKNVDPAGIRLLWNDVLKGSPTAP